MFSLDLLIAFALVPQTVLQEMDGQWYIVPKAAIAEHIQQARLTEDYRYIEPVKGLRVESDKVNRTRIPVRMVIQFENNSTSLSETDKARIGRLPRLYKQFLIEGHADPEGSALINNKIARLRAQLVARQLTRAGARDVRVVAYGERQPVCRDDTDQCKTRNRRVVIRGLEANQ